MFTILMTVRRVLSRAGSMPRCQLAVYAVPKWVYVATSVAAHVLSVVSLLFSGLFFAACCLLAAPAEPRSVGTSSALFLDVQGLS